MAMTMMFRAMPDAQLIASITQTSSAGVFRATCDAKSTGSIPRRCGTVWIAGPNAALKGGLGDGYDLFAASDVQDIQSAT